MKKKLMGIIAVVALAAFAGYNVYTSQNNVRLSNLALNNVEALANNVEENGVMYCCLGIYGVCGPHSFVKGPLVRCDMIR